MPVWRKWQCETLMFKLKTNNRFGMYCLHLFTITVCPLRRVKQNSKVVAQLRSHVEWRSDNSSSGQWLSAQNAQARDISHRELLVIWRPKHNFPLSSTGEVHKSGVRGLSPLCDLKSGRVWGFLNFRSTELLQTTEQQVIRLMISWNLWWPPFGIVCFWWNWIIDIPVYSNAYVLWRTLSWSKRQSMLIPKRDRREIWTESKKITNCETVYSSDHAETWLSFAYREVS